MNEIKVKKSDLLIKLKENKKNHRKMFEAALEGYRQTAIEELEKRLDDAKKGKRIDIYVRLHEPVDQTNDYDRAIAMLEMDINDTVELDANEFSQYVLDDWSWKQQFTASNSAYLTKVGFSG